MKSKKSSISLSMEAIIIIIIAITLLGLSLTFVKTFFGRTTEGVKKVIDINQLDETPTASDPLTIKNTILVEGGESVVKIGFYCNDVGGCDGVKPAIGDCSGLDEDILVSLDTNSVNVPVRGSTALQAILTVGTGQAGTYTCILSVGEDTDPWYTEKQFYIELTG